MLPIGVCFQEMEKNRECLESRLNSRSYNIKEKCLEWGEASPKESELLYGSVSDFFVLQEIVFKKILSAEVIEKRAAFMLASFIGAEYALSGLSERYFGRVRTSKKSIFEGDKIDWSNYYPMPREQMLGVLGRGLDSRRGNLFDRVNDYFYWVKKSCEDGRADFAKYSSDFDKISGSVNQGFEFRGFSARKVTVDKPGESLGWDSFAGYVSVVSYFKDLKLLMDRIDYCLGLGVLSLGDIIPKGILLVGPPGTGKTTLGRILCREAKVPYDIFGISEVGSSYVFETCKRVRDKFDYAASWVKSGDSRFYFLFLDELDSIGRERSAHSNGGREDDKVVTTICQCMDGPYAVPGVVVIGSTNLYDSIDKALVRPGRFSEVFFMDYLTREDAFSVLSLYTRNGCADINVDEIIRECYGDPRSSESKFKRDLFFSGAFVRESVNRAKRTKLIAHLKDGSDYLVTTYDIKQEMLRQ